MANGSWLRSPTSPQELADAQKESEQKAGICTLVRDEAVNGEAATLFKAHNQSPDVSVDLQVWISKSSGLPLKQIEDIDSGGGPAGKSHAEVRYDYKNVSAPAVAAPHK